MSRLSTFLKRFSGWRSGVMLCAITTGFVFLLNATFMIYSATKHTTVGGVSDIFVGSCSKVARMDVWLHFAINVTSTMMLSASNYTMQIISSPTREEVDRNHKRRYWLDIGIPSVRNVSRISGPRAVMWLILGLSSIPLHLMYNSVVFSSISATPYQYNIVEENFTINPYRAGIPDQYSGSAYMDYMQKRARNGSLTKYNMLDCRSAYAVNYATKVGNVLLVTADTGSEVIDCPYEGSSGGWQDNQEIPYYWICGDGYSAQPDKNKDGKVCTEASARNSSNYGVWKLACNNIEYCMVDETPEACKISFNATIMTYVLVANFLKFTVMVLTLRYLRAPTLVTVGDAVASFLQRPDRFTRGMCLESKRDFSEWDKEQTQVDKRWTPKYHLWFESTNEGRWYRCNMLSISFIAVGIYFLRVGMHTTGIYNIKKLYELGFGTVNGNSIIRNGFLAHKTSILGLVLISNLPQLILSILYLNYNCLLSCLVAADEWSRFAYSRKSLRVTSPTGQQRSTYFLSLPYKYAIPLMITSGILHWLTSQSLFLALIYISPNEANAYLGEFSTVDLSTGILDFSLGYSCIAILCAIILGSLVVLFGILTGLRWYPPGIPVAGSCSAAISAACHPPPNDNFAALKPVEWGVTDEGFGGVGHCSFSSLEVSVPISGKKYT